MTTISTNPETAKLFFATGKPSANPFLSAAKKLRFFLIPVFVLLMSHTYSQTVIQVGTGVVTTVGSSTGTAAANASPYGVCVGSGNGGKKLQILYLASQINSALTTAGLPTGVPYVISTASWDVNTSVGTATCKNQVGTIIKMANT